MNIGYKNIGLETALKKIKHYCAYQERSHKEVAQKLYSYGLSKIEQAQMLSNLIEENYLNEERFAIAYAGGKFRINHWGKNKIKYELLQKQVSAYCIKKALAAINVTDYDTAGKKLIADKTLLLKNETNIFTKKTKLQNYMIGKGYEYELVVSWIKEILD